MGKLSIKASCELISIRPSKSNAYSAQELEVSGADETQPIQSDVVRKEECDISSQICVSRDTDRVER
jgi:hypothetical protein